MSTCHFEGEAESKTNAVATFRVYFELLWNTVHFYIDKWEHNHVLTETYAELGEGQHPSVKSKLKFGPDGTQRDDHYSKRYGGGKKEMIELGLNTAYSVQQVTPQKLWMHSLSNHIFLIIHVLPIISQLANLCYF